MAGCISIGMGLLVLAALADSLPAPDEDEEGTRGVVQPLSAAMSGNYTVSFAPLLAVLLNVFPRLMSAMRVPAQPLAATTHARGLEPLWEWERASLCRALEALPLPPHTHTPSDRFFYACSPTDDAYCPTSTQDQGEGEGRRAYRGSQLVSEAVLDECTRLEVRTCREGRARYRPDLDACHP